MSDTQETLPILDPIAFAVALILAPITVTALTCWLWIPIFALFYGALPYLAFGGPVFMWMVTRFPTRFVTFALGGLLGHALFVGCFALWAAANPGRDADMLGFYALWGIPFAMLWGGAFALFYRGFYRPLIA